MTLAVTIGHGLARGGLVLDALLAGVALCTSGGPRRLAVALALALTPVLLGAELWKSAQVVHLRHHPALAAAGAVAAVVVIVALATCFARRPRALALCAVVALPFRFSVLSGGTGGILLVLYVVIAAGALALVAGRLGAGEDEPRRGLLELALAVVVVLYAIQALYTPDASLAKAVEEVGFFLVPFAVLFAVLRQVPWDRGLLERCAQTVVGLALVFAAVGAVEYAARRLLFNTALNTNQRYFRVNSLFYDPNIFGRFIALTMILVLTGMLWETRRRRVLAAAVILGLLWLALLGSVSQSSMVALLVGLGVIGAARFSPRAGMALGGLVVAVAVVVAIAASGRLHLNLADSAGANNATGGRYSLVTQGIDLFADRPIAGFGSASFSCEFLRHADAGCGARPRVQITTSDSHTIPITVAAEQGVIGLVAYLALLTACVLRLAGRGWRRAAGRAAILAAFAALVVHSWFYADFLEDPITWTLLALGTVLARE